MSSICCVLLDLFSFSVSTDPPPPAIYTLSLHDALPISWAKRPRATRVKLHVIAISRQPTRKRAWKSASCRIMITASLDRKSTRLNSSHRCISYAVFCLKKKKKKQTDDKQKLDIKHTTDS